MTTALLGAGLGFVLVLYWRVNNRKVKMTNLVLLAIYYLVVVQLMRFAGCFHG